MESNLNIAIVFIIVSISPIFLLWFLSGKKQKKQNPNLK